MMYGWGWGGWILMTLAMVVLLGLVITGIVLGVRYLADGTSQRNRATSETNRVEDVLAERFARGEIDEDEFRRRMRALRELR